MGHGPSNIQKNPSQVRFQKAEDVRDAHRKRSDAEDAAAVREDESGRRSRAQELQNRRQDHKTRGRR